MNLFDEILNCDTCPDVDVITDENQQEVEDHLNSTHRHGQDRISTTAFIVAHRPDDRKRLEDLYNESKDFLDSDYIPDFLYHFDQRTWELDVLKFLRDNNVEVYPPERSVGPDFDTALGYVECIAVTRGVADNAVPLPKAAIMHKDGTMDEIEFQPVPTNAIKLRISSAISDKMAKYERYCQQDWFDKNKPRIIAISWFADGSVWASDHRDISTNASLQTLFGTGYPQITIDPNTHEVVSEGLSQEPVLRKANNSEIPVGYFAKPPESDDKRIDGVILSSKWPGLYAPDSFRTISNPFTGGVNLDALSLGLRSYTSINDEGNGIKIETLPPHNR